MAATTATYSGAMPSQSYPQMPASPTLTDPDMILPDYDRPPSMDLDNQDLDRSQSPLMMWKNAQGSTPSVDLAQQLYTRSSATLDTAFGSGPMTPTTPIIYGNGTMLSDIGEVTEVESTPGKPWTSRPRGASSGNDSVMDAAVDAIRSSPTMGLDGVKKLVRRPNDRRRSGSIGSNSTITTQDRPNIFADFDDSISVGDDSVFLGDDEESVADSYMPDEPPKAAATRPLQTDGRIAPAAAAAAAAAERRAANSGKDSESMQESLSQRAELILANAKRRLTTMEGNLNRARSTLHSHSPSLTSLGSDSPSPSPTRAFVVSPGHSRMGSENTFRIGLPVKVYPQRSASALGAAGGYRQPLTTSKSVDNIRHSAHDTQDLDNKLSPSLRDAHLTPLSENHDDVEGSVMSDARSTAQNSRKFLSPTFGYPDEERIMTRSASVNQVRDLKDQVQDLKGKISSLRDQARVDSIRRRSFQSLRTPSPFTNARVDQWYDGSDEAKAAVVAPSKAVEESGTDRGLWKGEIEIPIVCGDQVLDGAISAGLAEDSSLKIQAAEAAEGVATDEGFETAKGGVHDDQTSDMVTEDGDYDRENAGYETESGESSYHDTLQHPLSHEDREDAFDYEHFILHSALGTIAQQRMARRERGSFSSEESAETTRGPVTDPEPVLTSRVGMGLRRTASHLSTGTSASRDSFDSFATADEGRGSRDGGRRTAEGSRSRAQTRARSQHREDAAAATTPTIAEESDRYSGFITPVDEGAAEVDSSNEGSSKGRSKYPVKYSPPPAATIMRRPASSAATHTANRPSVSSLESTGTMRSFPLVSHKKATSLTSVPNTENLRHISNHIMNDAAAVYEQRAGSSFSGRSSPNKKPTPLVEPETPLALQQLLREDQFLVERLVASIGKCVLGLTENGRSSSESRMHRRRLDAARRILEGIDAV